MSKLDSTTRIPERCSGSINIFILDNDIKKCVKYYNDKHCVKIILEIAQLLCSAHHICGNSIPKYKLSHKNHPISKWVRQSLSNYMWTTKIGLALCKEYTYRYNKKHKSQEVIEWCIDNKPNILDLGLTKFYLAMPDKYKCEDIVKSYRNYYIGEKQHIAQWNKREIPEWFIFKKENNIV